MNLKVLSNSTTNEPTTKDPWYADGLSFTCTQCGNCCTGGPGMVWLSLEELSRLAAHLKLTEQETADKYCRQVGGRWSLKENHTPAGLYDCTFLKTIEENGQSRRVCTIYPVRPLQCRTWPFWTEVIKVEKAWQMAARKCPGMGKGRRYSVAQIHALRDAKDWPERPPTSEEQAPVDQAKNEANRPPTAKPKSRLSTRKSPVV